LIPRCIDFFSPNYELFITISK